MWRSIFFSFPCIDLKFCKQPSEHCRIINYGLDLNYKVSNCACADLSFLLLHILTWNFLHSYLFVPATISQAWVCSFHTKICGNCMSTLLLSSLRTRRRYHRAQRDSIRLVCLSVVCLSSNSSQPMGPIITKMPTQVLQAIARISQDLILTAVQSPAPQRPPKNDPQNENFYFLTDWHEILYVTSWPLQHHKSWFKSQLQGAQLHMRRSISFSFVRVCIDLKFCR